MGIEKLNNLAESDKRIAAVKMVRNIWLKQEKYLDWFRSNWLSINN
jgi:hypothetical protein